MRKASHATINRDIQTERQSTSLGLFIHGILYSDSDSDSDTNNGKPTMHNEKLSMGNGKLTMKNRKLTLDNGKPLLDKWKKDNGQCKISHTRDIEYLNRCG